MHREGADAPALGRALELSLSILRAYPRREVVIPVMGSALEEPLLRRRVLEDLLEAREMRAPREIIRRFHLLEDADVARAIGRTSERLLDAGRQLLRSARSRTRANVALLGSALLARDPGSAATVLPLLLVLIDDPRVEVAAPTRRAFLTGLRSRQGQEFATLGARDPVLGGLGILLSRFEQHRDIEVIRAIFAAGLHGADLLGKAIGENWAACQEILRIAEEPLEDPHALRAQVDGLFRWLDSPFLPAREAARGILRRRADRSFLICAARRLESTDGERRHREYSVYRHIQWHLLGAEEMRTLRAESLDRIAGYLSAATVPPAERANRLASLIPALRGDARLRLLAALRELPTESMLEHIEPLLAVEDRVLALAATELISVRGERRAWTLLVRQLRSPFEEVRELAQRKLSGQCLAFYFDSYSSMHSSQRRKVLDVIRRVDIQFDPQLRRALRGPEEDVIIKALRTVQEIDDVAGFEDGLFDLTVNPSGRVRATLAGALRVVAAEPRLHYLRIFLGDADARVVANAVEALDDLHEARARPWISELRAHPNARVRANALLALARTGDAAAAREIGVLATSAATPAALRASAAWAARRLAGEAAQESELDEEDSR